ncbi:P-loop containing nucleoside triphosphate hydrolase protein [Apiospora hydei]|uniref:P-loop containing nucleoside triphosphate hydrolase protein n=1 Tax=Apiospora hydei TaxID=1337664 RepID=A0ABR1WXL7_9PEZI
MRPDLFQDGGQKHTSDHDASQPLIAVMGTTGSGKSSFINHITSDNAAKVGDSLEACTRHAHMINFQLDGMQGSIIDTPGFDDTNLSEYQILEEVSLILQTLYHGGKKLSGLIYLIDITSARWKGSDASNLTLFSKICGEDSYKNIIFVTTKWDLIDDEKAVKNEAQFKEKYLSFHIQLGARLMRHRNTSETALRVVSSILGQSETVLKIQKELVDGRMGLKDTVAGLHLATSLQQSVESSSKRLAKFRNEWRAASSPIVREALEAAMATEETKLRNSKIDQEKLESANQATKFFELANTMDQAAKFTGMSRSDLISILVTKGLAFFLQSAYGMVSKRTDSNTEIELLKQELRNVKEGMEAKNGSVYTSWSDVAKILGDVASAYNRIR